MTLPGIGTQTTLAIRTMAVMGSTEENASLIFSNNTLFIKGLCWL
jgi:hypothetical protein